MAQTLLLGLGGTGSRIVNYVADELKKKNLTINDGNICCAVLDTDSNDRSKLINGGATIPVIGTSKERVIADYMKMYAYKNVDEWMPTSPELEEYGMQDGASQMRSKSRLALMDSMEDGTLRELEKHIEKMFDNRDGAKIRVMLVSSLAGGTGSGMFIQTALWLRKFFKKRNCAITIRGILVLPDVFIKTVADMRKDGEEQQSLYANAYGAIRELNAITKIKTKGYEPQIPVKLDGLFDSDTDCNDGSPVFDYAFFIDDISEGGSVLTELEQYEQVAARMVYMQLYAPMHGPLYSEEDNLFKRFAKSDEPMFGSCGTAKAIYPTQDIVSYCAMRAAQDSLSTGWRKLDLEIKEKQRKEDERERSGVVVKNRIVPRAEYIRLFDAKTTKEGNQVGQDRLFTNIAHDIHDEKRVSNGDGTVAVTYLDKVDQFTKNMRRMIETAVDTQDPAGLSEIRLDEGWKDIEDESKDDLLMTVADKASQVQSFLDQMDDEVDGMASELLDRLCCADMGEVNPENQESVYGLLTKKDNNEEINFVHPIAVRYMLYKLSASLDKIKAASTLTEDRYAAQNGYGRGKQEIDFDNPRTSNTESGPAEYLNSRAFLQSEAKFLKTFREKYDEMNASQFYLCRAYAVHLLEQRVAITLSKRIEQLIDCIESFFKNLVKVSNSLGDAIADNVRRNNKTQQKIIYVCASEKEKEALYKSMSFDTAGSDAEINRIIVRSLYGQFCAGENAHLDNNKPFVGKSVENIFYTEVLATYTDKIYKKHSEEVDLDIYQAVCKVADLEYEKQKAEADKLKAESDRLENLDLATGETIGDDRHQRHLRAMKKMVDRLMDLGAPFLIAGTEYPEDKNEHIGTGDDADANLPFNPLRKRKTFWGVHPLVVENCPELGEMLGVDIKRQSDKAYLKNELDCYRAVYGIQAGHVDKFNEEKGGAYYANYRRVVRQMTTDNPDDLILTPHLDKTWHLFLPYITPEKQLAEEKKFYRLFWLALAYGLITLDKNGKYQIIRKKKIATGTFDKNEQLQYNGQPISKPDVLQLLAALRLDPKFMYDAAAMEQAFAMECAMPNYEGTLFLRGKTRDKEIVGGLGAKNDNNAMTIIVRYHNSTRHEDSVTASLIAALEELCRDLVRNNYGRNENAKIERAGYELCKRIYDASTMKDKDIELINPWQDAWSKKGAAE